MIDWPNWTHIASRLLNRLMAESGNYEAALKEAFLKTDEDLRADPNFFNDPSGCPAVVGLVTQDGRIIVANSGDSRSVLGHKGLAKAMSNDHKPTNKGEHDGETSSWQRRHRVSPLPEGLSTLVVSMVGHCVILLTPGNLALSRALGDFEFKQNFSLDAEKQIVTANPEIITHKIDQEEEFLVLASEGEWSCRLV